MLKRKTKGVKCVIIKCGGISPRDAKNKMKNRRKRKMGKAREIKFPQYNK